LPYLEGLRDTKQITEAEFKSITERQALSEEELTATKMLASCLGIL
jgi:hypothetical protein